MNRLFLSHSFERNQSQWHANRWNRNAKLNFAVHNSDKWTTKRDDSEANKQTKSHLSLCAKTTLMATINESKRIEAKRREELNEKKTRMMKKSGIKWKSYLRRLTSGIEPMANQKKKQRKMNICQTKRSEWSTVSGIMWLHRWLLFHFDLLSCLSHRSMFDRQFNFICNCANFSASRRFGYWIMTKSISSFLQYLLRWNIAFSERFIFFIFVFLWIELAHLCSLNL